MSNFHALEDVGRGSETHLQVRENLNCIYYIYFALKGLSRVKLQGYWVSSVSDIDVRPVSSQHESHKGATIRSPRGEGGEGGGAGVVEGDKLFISTPLGGALKKI